MDLLPARTAKHQTAVLGSRERIRLLAFSRDSITSRLPSRDVIWALAALSLLGATSILQSPMEIGNDFFQGASLSLTRAVCSILLPLYILFAGINLRRLFLFWCASTLVFLMSPILGLLSDAFAYVGVYYLSFGFATTVSTVFVGAIASKLEWNQLKYIVPASQTIAYFISCAFFSVDAGGTKASALCIFAALVLITLIRFANRSTFNLSDEAFPRRAFGANGSANRNVLPLLIVAIGGTALAPSLFGVFELVSWDVPELFVYREAASFVGNIAAPLLFVCAYMFGKEIGVDASFFFVAFASFVLVVSSAINSELTFLPVLFSRVLTIFFHVACWLFCFKAAKSEQTPLSAGLLMGLTDAVSWMGRLLGNATVVIVQRSANEALSHGQIALCAMTVLAAVILITLFATYMTYRKIFKSSFTHASEEVTFNKRVDEIVEIYGLSEREAQILREYVSGRSAPYIASALFLSTSTVKNHISRIYSKTGVNGRQRLIDLVKGGANELD